MMVMANRQGHVLTEFVIIIPVLLVLLLAAIEFPIFHLERNLLYWGALEGTKKASQQLLERKHNNNSQISPFLSRRTQLFSGDGNSRPCSNETRSLIQKNSAFAMVPTTIGMTSLLQSIGSRGLADGFQDKLSEMTKGKNLPYLLVKTLESYPVAYFLTSVIDCKMVPSGIKAKVQYYRQGKLPFIDGIIYGLYFARKYLSPDDDPYLVELDDNFFGMKVRNTKGMREAISKINQAIQELEEMNFKLDEISEFLGILQQQGIDLGTPYREAMNFFGNRVKELKDLKSTLLASTKDSREALGRIYTGLVYSIPKEMRFVPIIQEVFYPFEKMNEENFSTQNWGKAYNFLIAPFKAGSSGNEQEEFWEVWAKSLVTYKEDRYLR